MIQDHPGLNPKRGLRGDSILNRHGCWRVHICPGGWSVWLVDSQWPRDEVPRLQHSRWQETCKPYPWGLGLRNAANNSHARWLVIISQGAWSTLVKRRNFLLWVMAATAHLLQWPSILAHVNLLRRPTRGKVLTTVVKPQATTCGFGLSGGTRKRIGLVFDCPEHALGGVARQKCYGIVQLL